jgi:hypothetical protein
MFARVLAADPIRFVATAERKTIKGLSGLHGDSAVVTSVPPWTVGEQKSEDTKLHKALKGAEMLFLTSRK